MRPAAGPRHVVEGGVGPRATTSNRPGAQDATAGAEVSRPPSGSQLLPVDAVEPAVPQPVVVAPDEDVDPPEVRRHRRRGGRQLPTQVLPGGPPERWLRKRCHQGAVGAPGEQVETARAPRRHGHGSDGAPGGAATGCQNVTGSAVTVTCTVTVWAPEAEVPVTVTGVETLSPGPGPVAVSVRLDVPAEGDPRRGEGGGNAGRQVGGRPGDPAGAGADPAAYTAVVVDWPCTTSRLDW